MAAHQVNVYFWLIDTIASGNLTRDDINRRWAHCRYNDNHEEEFPERKFHRYKEEIQEIFDVDIRCSKSRGNVFWKPLSRHCLPWKNASVGKKQRRFAKKP